MFILIGLNKRDETGRHGNKRHEKTKGMERTKRERGEAHSNEKKTRERERERERERPSNNKQ